MAPSASLPTPEELDTLKHALNRFAEIPDEEWTFVASRVGSKNLAKGELFILEGDVPHTIGFIQRGLFRKFYTTEDGQEWNKDFAEKGQLIASYTSMLQRIPSVLTFEALEATRLSTLDYNFFISLYQRHPCWERLGRRVAELLLVEREFREFSLLRYAAKDRYRIFLEHRPHLAKRIPQYHIASYLGISEVSLSRIVRQRPPRVLEGF